MKGKNDMRKIVVTVMIAVLTVGLAGTANAVLPETPDNVPMVNDTVRAIRQVGNVLWVEASSPRSRPAAEPSSIT